MRLWAITAAGGGAGAWVSWLLTAGGGAVVVALAVAVCVTALGRWMTAAGRGALWLLVVARLVMPAVGSRMSAYNWVGGRGEDGAVAKDPGPRAAGAVTYGAGGLAVKDVATADEVVPAREDRAVSWAAVAVMIWVVGAGVWVVRMGVARVRLRRIVRGARGVTDAGALRVLEECRRAMGVRRRVELRETAALAGPALAGEWRGVLLVPAGMVEALSVAEWRCVCLHELAHLRRWDVLMDRVLDLVRAGHWFNPAAHVAVARFRGERELARDAMAMRVMGAGERAEYGRTLVRLAQGWGGDGGRVPAGAVGMTEPKRELRRRVGAVALGARPRWWRAVVGVVACVAIAAGLLTGRVEAKGNDGVTTPATTRAAEPTAGPTTRDLAVLERLDRGSASARYDHATLGNSLEFVRESTGVPINVDWAALKAAGVGPEEPITCRVRDAKASRLLRAVLEAAGGGRVQLDYVVENGGVTVSTRKEIERRSVVTRVYDLTDLMSSLGETKVEEGTASALGEVRTTKTPEAAAAERGAAIVKLMSDSVDPESWKAGGWGQIHLVGNTLWVRQTPENQELVAGVLATLRQAAGAHGLMVEVEMHLVTVSAEGFAKLPLAELGKGPKPAWELDDAAAGKVLAAARADAGTTLVTTPRMRLFNGQRGTLRIGQEQAYVAGIERGADGTMKPKVGTVSTGLGADIQATVSADRHYVTTTFKVVTANLLEMRAGAEEAPGLTVQVPVTWNRKLEQTVSTPDGGTLVERMPGGYVLPAGEAAGKGDEGRVVLVMVRPVIFADGKRVGDVGR